MLGRQSTYGEKPLLRRGFLYFFPNIFPENVPCALVCRPVTVFGMLITITEAAERLGWHRTTVWRKIRADRSFPAVVYIGPKSPRINVEELDRWAARQSSPNSDFCYVSPDLLRCRTLGPLFRRTRPVAL